jgi:hypothetical protein
MDMEGGKNNVFVLCGNNRKKLIKKINIDVNHTKSQRNIKIEVAENGSIPISSLIFICVSSHDHRHFHDGPDRCLIVLLR